MRAMLLLMALALAGVGGYLLFQSGVPQAPAGGPPHGAAGLPAAGLPVDGGPMAPAAVAEAGAVPVRLQASGGAPGERGTAALADGAPFVADAWLTATVRVRVLGPEGRPIAGARLHLAAGGSWLPDHPFEGFEREAETDAAGLAALAVPPLGPFALAVEKEGFAARRDVLLLPGDDTTLALERGAELLGRVQDRLSQQPVAGAEVRVAGRGVRELAVTDESGLFRVTDLDAGLYRIEVVAEGYVPGRAQARAAAGGALAPQSVDLDHGGVLEGQVQDAFLGVPVPGARLEVVAAGGFSGEAGALAATQADGAGRFRFERVACAEVQLLVRAEGYVEQRRFVGEGDAEEPIQLSLTPGSALGGVVRNLDGEGVGRAELMLSGRGRDGTGVLRTVADDAGRFLFEGVAPLVRLELLVLGREQGLAPGTVREIVLERGQFFDGLEVTLEPGGTIQGVVRDLTGEPVALAHVVVDGIPNQTWRVLRRGPVAFTDEEGRFAMQGLPEGLVTLSARSGDGVSEPVEVAVVPGGEQTLVLVVAAGAALAGTAVERGGAPVAGALVTAYGVDPDFALPELESREERAALAALAGTAPGDAREQKKAEQRREQRVRRLMEDEQSGRLFRQAAGRRGSLAASFRGAARTDERGAFEMKGLWGDERLLLVAQADGFASKRAYEVRPGAAAPRIVLSRLVTLSGQVVDRESRDPVARFRVAATPLGDPPIDYDDPATVLEARRERVQGFQTAGGSFQIDEVEPGAYHLVASAAGYRSAEPVEVVAGGDLSGLVLELIPVTAVRGRVLTSAGARVWGLPVFLERQTGGGDGVLTAGEQAAGAEARKRRGAVRRQPSDRQGSFAFADVRPGRYLLGLGDARAPLGRPVVVEVADGARVERRLTFDDVGSLALLVQGGGGLGLPRAKVKLEGQGIRAQYESDTDGSGRVSFKNIVAGEYQVVINAKGHERRRESILVAGGASDSRAITLIPKG